MMPTAFLSHGAPDRVLSHSLSHKFLRGFADLIESPKGILIISAHWQTSELTLTAPGKLSTIHDFYGFSPELHQYSYTAHQTEAFTALIMNTLKQQDVPLSLLNKGLDHGSWSVLSLAYPDPDMPIANLSLPHYGKYSEYIALGERLAALRAQGVLIIGSGSATHNLRALALNQPTPNWVKAFVTWLQDTIDRMDLATLAEFYRYAPHAQYAHPTPEHLLPLLVVAGAAKGETSQLIHDSYEFSSLNNSSFLFGNIYSTQS